MRPLQAITLSTLFAMALVFTAGTASANDANAEALGKLRELLSNERQLSGAAARSPQGLAALAQIDGLPDYARREILDIVMLIMTQDGMGAVAHVENHDKGGAKAAAKGFSPTVQARIKALQDRLAADPNFKGPAATP